MPESHVTPTTTCPYCQYQCDRAANAENSTAKPKPGDPTICFKCGEVSIFDENISMRKPTNKEIISLQLSSLWPVIQKTVTAIRKIKEQK